MATEREKMEFPEDKRANRRYEYPYDQLVAPALPGGKMPPLTEFERVACDDVSCGGIAFFLPTEPETEEYVVGLGKPPEIEFVQARVTNCEPAVYQGEICFRVGCQFQERLHLD